MSPEGRIQDLLTFIYGAELGEQTWQQLEPRLAEFSAQNPELTAEVRTRGQLLDQRDAILITYGDQFSEPVQPPLQTLKTFMSRDLENTLNGVHILPCFPYSSDDGFSVIDYLTVDPALGTWEDVRALGDDFRLMLDAVVNHISRHSAWFQGFLDGDPKYADYFIVVDPAEDLSEVVRPRALPLLTPVATVQGVKHVWTTFSDDQIDLNYDNPAVLLAMTDVLLAYVAAGAQLIRLDAIAFMWKVVGSSCLHLPRTHAVVKLWRAVLDQVAPNVLLITETNVPHADNISYFGDPLPDGEGTDEAQLVYNFSLAPLVLHTFRTQNATDLTNWVDGLASPPGGATFFNFIASHDGIGMRPAENLLEPADVQALIDQAVAHGGQVSYKANQDGSKSVYELNVTLYDFLNDPARVDQPLDVARFSASQAILLSLAGVPGIYVHSLFGSRNCHACLDDTGRARSINREKFEYDDLTRALSDTDDHRRQVFDSIKQLLRLRRNQPAFHPTAPQRVLRLHPSVFALLRTPHDGDAPVLCLVSASDHPLQVSIDTADFSISTNDNWTDLISGETVARSGGKLNVSFNPYQVCWLVSKN
ncbi:MAG: sugar phosphorylase [Caldilineae bacterium]|nr:sugar phosphorylase [Caldilineae bacterium]